MVLGSLVIFGRAWDYVAKWSRGLVSRAGGSGVVVSQGSDRAAFIFLVEAEGGVCQ